MKTKFLSRKFILTVFSMLSLILPSILELIPHHITATLCTVIVSIYMIANAIAKTTKTTIDDQFLEDFKTTILPILEKNSKKK